MSATHAPYDLGKQPTSGCQRYAVLLTPDHGETVKDALCEIREAIACYLGLPDVATGLGDDRVEVIMATVAVAAA